MTQERIKINNNKFEYMDVAYDCEYAIEKDIELILDEAKKSHPDFSKLYVVGSIKPREINVYFDNEGKPMFGMIIYSIDYKDILTFRIACGGYYPIGEKTVNIHPYQYSICW